MLNFISKEVVQLRYLQSWKRKFLVPPPSQTWKKQEECCPLETVLLVSMD